MCIRDSPDDDADAPTRPLTPDVLAAQHEVPHLGPEIARRLALQSVPVRSGVTRFVTVGRVSPEKNHGRLLRAFAQVRAERGDVELVVIGNGPLFEPTRPY